MKQDEGIVLIDQGVVAIAQVNLNWCRITSPIDGRAGVRLLDPGNYVTTGATNSTTNGLTGSTTSPVGIVIVNQIEPIAVIFSVPQGDYQRLSEVSDGFRKPLATQALSQDTGASLGTGQLSIADNRVDPTTGTVKMKARFDNTGDLLLPGQFVNVKLTLQTLSNVITIPAAAVNVGPNGPFAYVVGADQTVSMQAIKVGPTEGTTTVITTGLQAGETVVIDGQMTLSAGSLVKVAAPAPAPSPAPTTPTQTPSAQTPAAPTTPTQTPSAQTPAAATPAAATPAAATPAAQTPAAQAPAAATPAAATPAAQTPAAATPAPQRSATQ